MPAKRRRSRRQPQPHDARERAAARDRESAPIRELVEFETATEGSTAEPRGESGTLPGSVGGTTGTAGRAPGIQTPGAKTPGFPGISPEEARRLRGKKRGKGHARASRSPPRYS